MFFPDEYTYTGSPDVFLNIHGFDFVFGETMHDVKFDVREFITESGADYLCFEGDRMFGVPVKFKFNFKEDVINNIEIRLNKEFPLFDTGITDEEYYNFFVKCLNRRYKRTKEEDGVRVYKDRKWGMTLSLNRNLDPLLIVYWTGELPIP